MDKCDVTPLGKNENNILSDEQIECIEVPVKDIISMDLDERRPRAIATISFYIDYRK